MAIVTLFKNKHGSVAVLTPKGEPIHFAQGRFWTTQAKFSNYLQQLADNGNECGVYVDPQEPEIDTENTTPLEILRRKIRLELEAEIKAGKINATARTTPGNSEQASLQNSTQNTMGTATAEGVKAQNAPATATVKVDGSGDGSGDGTQPTGVAAALARAASGK